MSTKNTLKSRDTPFGKFPISNRRLVASRTSYVSVVYFHFDKQNFGIPTNTKTDSQIKAIETDWVTKATRGVIEEEIYSMSISKSIDGGGTFNLSLLPNKNWKRILSPGDWILIYIYDTYGDKDRAAGATIDTTNLLMLANIDRISRSLQKNEDTDENELRYNVSGRSFSKVFDKSDIWFNPYANQVDNLNNVALVEAGLEYVGSPDEMCNAIIDTFLGPGAEFSSGRTPSLNTWKIPDGLARVFNQSTATSPRFYDILAKEITEGLPGFKARQMLSLDSNGALNEMLRRSSNNLVNDFFYEDVRGNDGSVFPTVVLRPRPVNTPFFFSHFNDTVAYNKALGSLNNKFQTLQDLARNSFVEISPAEIKYEDIGKDDHSRFNLFWLRTALNYEHELADPAFLNNKKGIANPTFLQASVERYGLARFDQVLDFCYTVGSGGKTANQSPSPNIDLWRAFIGQLYDMHYANHLYDGGTIECSGVLEAELGKALVVSSGVQNIIPKAYYIEGYEHKWSFGGIWTTTFTVSHGQFKLDQGDRIYIDARDDDFGQPDQIIDSAYLSKTNVPKGPNGGGR